MLDGYIRLIRVAAAVDATLWHGIHDGQSGTLTVSQRVGSGLQSNVHLDTLALDPRDLLEAHRMNLLRTAKSS